jgi:hypothetical protein
MAYSEPKLQIFQDFEPVLVGGAEPLHACIIGPSFALHRFDVEDEQAFIAPYDRAEASEIYPWPDHVAGGVIDLDSAKIMAEDTLVRYFEGISAIDPVADGGNQFTSLLVFKTGNGFDRDVAFGQRDVQVGDYARVTWIDPGDLQQYQFLTQVAGFVADVVPGTTDPDPFRVTGFGDTTVGATESVTNPSPTKYTTAYDATAYDGLADGYPQDTYTIRVTQQGYAGAGGLDGTILSITSAGNDTPNTVELGVDVIYNGSEYLVPLGSRGAILDLEDAGAGTVSDQATWDVTVSQNYTEVDVSMVTEFKPTGPYTGTKNTQYIMTIVTGGTVGTDNLVINVTTNNGADIEEQITIPAADFPPAQNDYSIGNNGMLLSFFDTTQWNTGDVVTFDVEAPSSGAYKTLVFRDNLDIDVGTSADLELFIQDTVEFPSTYTNLSQDDIEILGDAFIIADYLGNGDEPFALFFGDLYADYREQRTEGCNELEVIEQISDVTATLGPVSPLNPLAKGVNHALENSAGVSVFYMAVCTDDLAGYSDALDVLTENDTVYGLVPLNSADDVQDLFKAHVEERSSAINNQWRIAWLANTAPQQEPIVTTKSNGDDILATVSELSPSLYRQVDAPDALFITSGVDPGGRRLINIATDAEGTVTYDTYTVDRVESETQLIITGTLTSPVVVPIKIEVYRNLSNSEYATALAQEAARFNTRRVTLVWADNPVEDNGDAMELIYLCSALSGERSGVPPHAPMSNLEVFGVDLDPLFKFSRTQMNTIAAGGVWLVVKDFDGRVFTRHQLTSYNNTDDLNQREQSKTTNLDHISRDFHANTQDLFGQGNISPEMINLIRQRINSLIEKISNRAYPAKIGPQMLDAEILRLERDTLLRDTITVEINPGLPDPLNTLNILFTVS